MKGPTDIKKLFQHLQSEFDHKRLTSKGYVMDFKKVLKEMHQYASECKGGADGFMLACQDFLKENGEPKHK